MTISRVPQLMFLWGAPSCLLVQVHVFGRLHGVHLVRLFHLTRLQLRQSDRLIQGVVAKLDDCVVVQNSASVPLLLGALVTSGMITMYLVVLDGLVGASGVVRWGRQPLLHFYLLRIPVFVSADG